MGIFLKCRLDQAFPPNDVFVCFLLKTSSSFSAPLSGKCACLQGSTLICLHRTESGSLTVSNVCVMLDMQW